MEQKRIGSSCKVVGQMTDAFIWQRCIEGLRWWCIYMQWAHRVPHSYMHWAPSTKHLYAMSTKYRAPTLETSLIFCAWLLVISQNIQSLWIRMFWIKTKGFRLLYVSYYGLHEGLTTWIILCSVGWRAENEEGCSRQNKVSFLPRRNLLPPSFTRAPTKISLSDNFGLFGTEVKMRMYSHVQTIRNQKEWQKTSFCSEICSEKKMVAIFKEKDEGKTYFDSRPRSPWHSCRSRCPPCPCTGPLCSTPPTFHRLPCTLRCWISQSQTRWTLKIKEISVCSIQWQNVSLTFSFSVSSSLSNLSSLR